MGFAQHDHTHIGWPGLEGCNGKCKFIGFKKEEDIDVGQHAPTHRMIGLINRRQVSNSTTILFGKQYIFLNKNNDDKKNDSNRPIIFGDNNDDGPDGPRIYRYKVTISLNNLDTDETNVRVSASGEVEQDGKILSTGGVHELEFFQKFFAGMSQGLFLDQNVPVKN